MIYIYLDESGDLGFNFENKKPSDFFTITVVVVRNIKSNKWIKKEIETTIKRKLNTKIKNKRFVQEIKWSKTELWIKKYLFKRIDKFDFEIYSITFNKRWIYEKLKKNKARLYNYFVKQLIDKINFDNVKNRITIVLDKSKNKEQIKDCNDYLIRNIENRISLEVDIDILHEDSIIIKQLQLADVFCYWFFEKYNKKNTSWLEIFKNRVKYDELWF